MCRKSHEGRHQRLIPDAELGRSDYRQPGRLHARAHDPRHSLRGSTDRIARPASCRHHIDTAGSRVDIADRRGVRGRSPAAEAGRVARPVAIRARGVSLRSESSRQQIRSGECGSSASQGHGPRARLRRGGRATAGGSGSGRQRRCDSGLWRSTGDRVAGGGRVYTGPGHSDRDSERCHLSRPPGSDRLDLGREERRPRGGERDPATRIADIENVEIVFKDGVGYDTKKLLDSVKGRYGEY
jgi:hypothetical protein